MIRPLVRTLFVQRGLSVSWIASNNLTARKHAVLGGSVSKMRFVFKIELAYKKTFLAIQKDSVRLVCCRKTIMAHAREASRPKGRGCAITVYGKYASLSIQACVQKIARCVGDGLCAWMGLCTKPRTLRANQAILTNLMVVCVLLHPPRQSRVLRGWQSDTSVLKLVEMNTKRLITHHAHTSPQIVLFAAMSP